MKVKSFSNFLLEFTAKNSIRESKRRTAKDSSKKFGCQKCDQTFVSDDMLLQHMTTHEATGNDQKCAQCRMKFTFIEDLELHALIHTKTNIWQCSNCHKKCKSESKSNKMKNTELCFIQWRFSDRAELKQHIWYHFKEKPFKCDSCGKCFAKKESLRFHLERHVGKNRPTKFKCQLCPKKSVILSIDLLVLVEF